MKQFLKGVIRYVVLNAPWGAREAMLQACLERLGAAEIGTRLFSLMKIVEVGADGDRGIVVSAWDDNTVLPEYAQTGTFSETITEAFMCFFEDRPGTFIDVGANIGLTTIPIARKHNVRCLAFEPEPRNFGFLQRNVSRNAPEASVEFHQAALFHTRGTMALAIATGNIGDHRLTQSEIPGRAAVKVPTYPLDDFFDRVQGRLAIKIDTQGAEPFVVAGAEKMLARASMLAMEFCPYLMRQLGGNPDAVIKAVERFDRIAVMKGGTAETPEFCNPEEACSKLTAKLATARATDGDYLDILAVRDLCDQAGA